jgi:hypothetical protein
MDMDPRGGWFLVNSMGYTIEEMGYHVEAQAEFEANATLFAASKGLLAALQVARPHVLDICEHNERVNNGRPSELDRNDLAQIDAAIARALGKVE